MGVGGPDVGPLALRGPEPDDGPVWEVTDPPDRSQGESSHDASRVHPGARPSDSAPHGGDGKLIIWLLLLQLTTAAATPSVPRQVAHGHFEALQFAARQWQDQPLQPGPAPAKMWPSLQVQACDDPEEHWHAARQLHRPTEECYALEPGLRQVLEQQTQFKGDLNLLRGRIKEEITALRAALQQRTEEWFDELPGHIQKLYKAAELAIQVPMLRTLAFECGWRDTTLMEELETGFPFLGKLSPGWGWQKRRDDKYSAPLPLMDFFIQNEKYIHRKLRHHRTHPDWRILAEEIAEEVRDGKMEGPF